MAGRKRGLFGRKSTYAGEARRPVSARSKAIFVLCVLSVGFYIASVVMAAQTDGEIIKLFAGGGVILFYISLLMLAMAARRVKDDTEPMTARIAAVGLSMLSTGLWAYLYVLGMLHA